MASTHKSLRSGTAHKRPTTAIADGQIALNTNATSPGLFFKDSTGASILKIGPVHVGTTAPNASPAAGGSTGNSTGEVWLDTALTPPGVKLWDGSAWVNATPAGSTTVQGLLELATDAETQTGSDTARAVTPASLQSKISDSTATTSSTTIASSTAVKSAYDLASAALPKSGGTITGNLEIGTTGTLTFEGATADGFETTLSVVDPTADRTITLPNVTGTLVTTGDTGTVTNTMLAGSIDDTKLNQITTASKVSGAALTGTIPSAVLGNSTAYLGTTAVALNRASANQALTGVSSVAMPGATSGTITVTPAAVAGTTAITVPATSGTLITTGDSGTVTSTMLADLTIVNADINASAAIAHSKLANITAGQVLLGNASNVPTSTALSGDVTITSAGVTAIKSSVALGGSPTTTTQSAGTNNTTIATCAFVSSAVDAARQGLTVKQSCRVASTTNLTLSATQTIDGIVVAVGDRVLVKNQTTGSQNGIYIVAATAWTRATDFDIAADVTDGAFTFVEEGTVNADSGWVLTTDNPITIGTTSLTFVQFSGAGQITAGNGLSKTGNTLALATLTSGNIFLGNASNVATSTAVTGDVTISNAGVTAIAANVIVDGDIATNAAIAGTKVSPNFGSQNISTSGNITLSGTTSRFAADFTNATLTSRAYLQSSTTNGLTSVGALPNGTSTTAGLLAHNNSTPTNSAYIGTVIDNVGTYLRSTRVGTGTALPLYIQTGATATTRMTFDTAGDITIAGSARIKGDFSNGTIQNRVCFKTSTANDYTSVTALPNGTSRTSEFIAFNNSLETPTDCQSIGMRISDTGAYIESYYTGTAPAYPLDFVVDIYNVMQLATDAVNIYVPAIKADFSNASLDLRTYFQTTTAGSGTTVGAIPDSGGSSSAFFAFNSSNPTSAAYCGVLVDGSLSYLRSSRTGTTATALPLVIQTGSTPTTRVQINADGTTYFPAVGTTASAANAFLNSASTPANQLLRSTSSLRYKTDIENLEQGRSDAILDFRPVWYRSKAEADRKDWSWYGLIAEEVAEIEPRLVHWTYLEDAYEEIDGERQLKPGAEMVPDGVQYDRLTVLLLDVVQRQQKAIETLEAKVATLESA